MKKLILCIVIVLSVGCLFFPQKALAQSSDSGYNSATVEQVRSQYTNNDYLTSNITLKVTSGALQGKTIHAIDTESTTSTQYYYKPGDNVLFTYSTNSSGKVTAYIVDFDRRGQLLLLMVLFFALLAFVCRKQGIFSILGMLVSIAVIMWFLIPQIDAGKDPFILSLIAAFFIIPITYSLAHGIHRKTLVAIISSYITLAITTILAYAFLIFANLSTIIPNDELNYIQQTQGALDLRNLFLAGFVIGAVAVLNDITISQASIVRSLYYANKKISINELFSHAMSVGRDHIASLVNTLILVYIGVSLPLVITTFDPSQPVLFDINSQTIALEIVRTFTASIGIVLAVPITTYVTALVYKKGLLQNVKVPKFLQFGAESHEHIHD
jgi:uncharacterized membrane protein